MEIVYVVKVSVCPHICSLYCALTVEYPRLTLKKSLDSKTSQTRGQDETHPRKWSQIIYYFICFPLLILFHMARKVPGLTKINISISTYSLSEGNLSPSWRNTLGHIMLETMDDSLVLFIILTHDFYFNPIPHMVVPFLLVPQHRQEKCQERDRKRVQTATNKFQAQRKT